MLQVTELVSIWNNKFGFFDLKSRLFILSQQQKETVITTPMPVTNPSTS